MAQEVEGIILSRKEYQELTFYAEIGILMANLPDGVMVYRRAERTPQWMARRCVNPQRELAEGNDLRQVLDMAVKVANRR